MSGKQADLLDIIEHYNPSTVAKQKSLSVVKKSFGQYFSNVEDIREEGLLILYPFAALKPQMYYEKSEEGRCRNYCEGNHRCESLE